MLWELFAVKLQERRLQAVARSSDHQAERQVIEDGLASRRVLKRYRLGFPDWEKK